MSIDDRLLTAFREHEEQVRVAPDALGRVYVRHSQRVRRQRVAAVLGVVILAVVVAAGALLLRDTDSSTSVAAPSRVLELDVGGVDDFEYRNVREIEVPGNAGLFIYRGDDGFLALSRRNPRPQGCRLEVAANDQPFLFEDPCHGSIFAADGSAVGGPVYRGMYQYDTAVADGRVIVDLTFARPGPVRPQYEGSNLNWNALGPTDDVALEWFDALDRVADALQGELRSSPLWPLGVFHNLDWDTVSMNFTFYDASGEIIVGRADSWPHGTGGRELRELPVFGEITAGTVRLTSPEDEAVRSFALETPDGRVMTGGVLPATNGSNPSDQELLDLLDLLLFATE